MKYAVFSDLHANASALRAALADAKACGAKKIVCLGDVVGYGPLPSETLDLIRRHAAIIIAGNHDDAVSGRGDSSAFIDLAGDAVARHREALSKEDRDFLATLPHTAEFSEAIAAHGDFISPAEFNYVNDCDDAKANFSATNSQLLFVGHTHVPGFFLTGQSGNVYRIDPQDFVLEDGKRYLVNPGSIGYPRENNGECRSTYVIYDDAERTIAFRALPFSVASVMQRGRNPRGLRKRTIVLIAIAAACCAAALTVLFTNGTPNDAKTAERVAETGKRTATSAIAESPIAKKSLTLPPAAKCVRANLALAKGSHPVQLKITFKSSVGEPIGSGESRTVKGSSRQRFSIPDGAVTAEFTLVKLRSSDKPQVMRFDPTFENK